MLIIPKKEIEQKYASWPQPGRKKEGKGGGAKIDLNAPCKNPVYAPGLGVNNQEVGRGGGQRENDRE